MAKIRLDVDHTLVDGESLTFNAPCDCNTVDGIKAYYPDENGTEKVKEFAFKDAHGNDLGALENLFLAGAYVKVILNLNRNHAFIQNADTNAYLEAKFATKAPANHTHTYSDVGAAPASHKHSTDDLTSGTLPIARGGTGMTSNPSMLVNLASEAVASAFAANPRLGVTGILPVAHGGTGVSSLDTLATAMGAVNIEHFSYTGTGTKGKNYPNSLTFDKAPKIVALYRLYNGTKYEPIMSGVQLSLLHTELLTTEYVANGFLASNNILQMTKKSEDGKTIYWYTSGSTASSQFNESGYTYYGFAIC